MAYQNFYKQLYDDTVRELAGGLMQALLPKFCTNASKGGAVQFFDNLGEEDNSVVGTTTNIRSIVSSRDYYDTITTPDIDDFMATRTPNRAVKKQRTQAITQEIKEGKVFDREEEIAENANNQSMVLKTLVSKIMKARDNKVIQTLRAANAVRTTTDGVTTGNVAFPAGQILGGAGEITAYTKDIPTMIRELFELNWRMEEMIYCLINPTTKRELIDQSGSTIQNRDFVDKSEYFTNGRLPDIQGVVHVVHPLVPADEFLAWVPSALIYNQAGAFTTKMGEDPGSNFAVNLLLQEFVSTARVDDLLVVQGQITRAT